MEPILPPAPPAPSAAAAQSTPAHAPLPVKRRGHWHTQPKPGHITGGWATVYWIGWLLIACGFGAVWYSSRTTGLSTWWLGPESAPRAFTSPLPFIAPFVLAFLAIRVTRHLPWLGIGGAIVTALIAAGDLADEPKYAVVEFALAGAGLAISAACFAGMLREVDEPAVGDQEGPPAA